jgi:predicted GIY-YIG superfamily endonuclease
MYYVYILLLGNGQFYTADLRRRVPEHERGHVASDASDKSRRHPRETTGNHGKPRIA